MTSSKPASRLLLVLPLLACAPLPLLLATNAGEWTVFLGRFHPVVLHMPIGILLLVTLMEVLTCVSRGKLTFTTLLPLFLGAFSAVAAVCLGVLLMEGEGMSGALIEGHKDWGIATAVAAVLALFLRTLPAYAASKLLPGLYRLSLLAVCGIMGWASHQGASVTHGETYLTDHIPWKKDQGPSEAESALAAAIQQPNETREVYAHLIAPILELRCYHCHNVDVIKGDLAMDSLQGLLQGGEIGPAVVPGDLENSLAIERIHLPLEDEEHMPPAKEPQLTPGEIQILEWWIAQGAPGDKTIADLNPSAEIDTAIGAASVAVLEFLKLPKPEPEVEVTAEDVAQMREANASAVDELMRKYPGIIRYRSLLSSELVISAFHEQWGDADVEALEPVQDQIVELVLEEAGFSTAGAEAINGLSALKALDLRNGSIDDSFVLALDLPELTRLNLKGTPITDAALEGFTRFTELKKLYLTYTAVSTSAVQNLQAQLPDCTIVFAEPVVAADVD